MVDLEIQEYADYDSFAHTWHTDTLEQQGVTLQQARNQDLINEDETRLLWQLLGQLAPDEILVQIPSWLAEQKVGYVEGATPTIFIGWIERETDKAVLLEDTAAARSLMKLAHRIDRLEQNDAPTDQDDWLADRLEDHRREFEQREDVITLQDQWLPKSQLLQVIRRRK